jgi:YidC/Oxa1 family membrane protein insertase
VIVAGILTPIEDVLTDVLKWFHTSVGLSWAWSIVAVTVAVRILLVPVVVRQIHSMQSLQAHAPEMKEIQQRWKHDKQRQNEELMKFYKENKINPAASCIPIVAQIPIFLALYYVLRDFEKEIFPNFPASTLDWLNLVSITDNVRQGWGPLLVVVYVVSQFTSSWYMTSTTQGFQRYLILFMPLAFAPFVLIYNFPAGLMIYWLTTNLWTTGQGFMTRRMMPKPEPPEKRSSRTPAKTGGDGAKPAATGTKRKPAPAAAGAAQKAPAAAKRPVAGPPRRVKRKRSGGGGRR